MPKLIYDETVTTTGQSGIIDASFLDSVSGFRAALRVTDIGGTSPNFAVDLEDTADEANFETAANFAAATANGYETIAVSGPRFSKLRVNTTVSGTSPTARIRIYVE